MCGIIGAFNKNKQEVNEFIINQFENQQKRGKEGFGIIRINQNKKIEVDRACETTKFLLDLYLKKSNMIIAHHRTPTSTDNLIDQTHPMLVSNKLLNYDYLVIHNGMITNDDELRKKHIELGFTYTTEYEETYGYEGNKTLKFNDSESLAIELALFIEKKISAIGIDNNAAFMILQVNKKNQKATTVFFGKHGITTALNINKEKKLIQISSEGPGDDVEVDKLFNFDLNSKGKFKIKHIELPFVKKEIPKIETKTFPPIITPVEQAQKLITGEQSKLPIVIPEITQEDREWSSPDELLEKCPQIALKGYQEDMTSLLKEAIKTTDSIDITHIIDDCLDAELDKLSELMLNYKRTLIQKKFDNREEVEFTGQIFRIMQAMRTMTDVAEKEYETKADQEEIEDYNEGYNTNYKGNKEYLSEKKEEEINWPENSHLHTRFGFHGDY